MGKMLSFEVIVLDDREKFANRERFPDADQVIVADFGPTLDSLKITRATYIVIITRGHQYDEEALMTVADSPAAYIGMIGSRRRVEAVRHNLENFGVDTSKLERVRAPIGLEIGAQTPEEIAVSIIAEMIAVRRGGRGLPMSVIARDRELRLGR
jgi:xanthine dehydrogenase accessory factor